MIRPETKGPGEFAPEVERRLFVTTVNGRVACVVCGATGYPGCAWQRVHRRGHAPCSRCGRQMTLTKMGVPRWHTGCKGARP